MEQSPHQQQIELFHLLFLKHLNSKIDPLHYALKGGCNLRFYFKSIRYSEDMDLDVKIVARDTLKNQITKLLMSTAFQQILEARKLSLLDINPVKQTDTTQRWKMKIKGPHSTLEIPTKIEFSRRNMKEGLAFEPVDEEVITAYHLYPILSNHYVLNQAFVQKIEALVGRAETQARDVFDLHHLLEQGASIETLPKEVHAKLTQAIENVISISYQDYKSQVVSYLHHDYQEYFGSISKWNTIQEKLIRSFEFGRQSFNK